MEKEFIRPPVDGNDRNKPTPIDEGDELCQELAAVLVCADGVRDTSIGLRDTHFLEFQLRCCLTHDLCDA